MSRSGRLVREHVFRRLHYHHKTSSPRLLEPALAPAPGHGFLHPSILSWRHRRHPRPRQLRQRKYVPGRLGELPRLSRPEVHCLDLGLVLSVGYAARNTEIIDSLKQLEYMGICEAKFLAMLEYLCDPFLPLPSSPVQSQIVTGIEIPKGLKVKDSREGMYWARLGTPANVPQLSPH